MAVVILLSKTRQQQLPGLTLTLKVHSPQPGWSLGKKASPSPLGSSEEDVSPQQGWEGVELWEAQLAYPIPGWVLGDSADLHGEHKGLAE